MLYFCVSDIHSDYKNLKAALDKAGFNRKNKNHTLIVCGDVFDRMSETVEVYKFLSSIPKRRLVLIKGNHEELYLDLLKKSYPDQYDFSNHTVDTFCHIAGYDPEILSYTYWLKFDETDVYERIRQAWQEIKQTVAESQITKWIKSSQWLNYFELDKYIFVHSFIPLKNIDGLPSWYIKNRRFEYFENWRTNATDLEWSDSRWGCPYQQYLDGYFREEATNGKILVCGHWTVTDFRHHINNKKSSDDTSIYKFENIIALDCGVWKYRDRKEYYHPQNVLVIDDKDFKCYNQYGTELKDEELILR